MEVLMGPTAFGIDPAYVREAAAQDSRAAVASRMFEDSADEVIGLGSRIGTDPDEVSSASSSSIGTPSDDEEEEEEEDENDSSVNSDEAESKFRGGGSFSKASLNSLEDALPIKRGLSTHFAGKSKSFASLADVVTVKDLKKSENPLNKRRRLVIASKWAKKSFYSFANPKSMPLLALQENDNGFDDHNDDGFDDYDDDDDEEEQEQRKEQENHDHDQRSFSKFHEKRFKSFRARCFSLADLQEHSVLEDDE